MHKKIRPADNRIFVKEDEKPEQTETGIVLLNKVNKKEAVGTVVQIGNKVTEFKVGDRIGFSKAKQFVEIDGQILFAIFVNPSHLVKI